MQRGDSREKTGDAETARPRSGKRDGPKASAPADKDQELRLPISGSVVLRGSAMDGVLRTDNDGIIQFASSSMRGMIQYDSSELAGRPIYLFIDPKRREPAKLALEGEQRLGGSFETRFVRKDGAALDARISLFPFEDVQSGLRGSYMVVTDITQTIRAEHDLRQTRDYLENLLNYANAPIIVWDPEFMIRIFNRAFERLTGYQFEQVQGKHLEMLFPEDSREASLDKIRRTLNGEYWDTVEIPIMRRDGSVRVALWNSANVYDETGRTLVSTIAQGQDITERKRTEQQLVALNESLMHQTIELEAVNKELESFNYSISHDLRGPLRSIEGFGDMVIARVGDKLDEESLDHVGRMRAASEHMGRLIDDLLDLSKVTRRKMRWERVDLSALAEKRIAELRKSTPEREVETEVVQGAAAVGDGYLLRQMMASLMDNAWKFTARQSHPRVEFGITYINSQETFFVRDNGVGFEMQYYSKLFAPFQRLHTDPEFPGTGIGLVKAQRIVRRHGGRIWGEGEVGKGATFYFTLGEANTEGTPGRG